MKTLKRITLATVKSFAKKYSNNLYVKELSNFNGMTDGIEVVKGDFQKTTFNPDNNRFFKTGIKGFYTVGSGRDYFNVYEDESFIGIIVDNACGSAIVATKKEFFNNQKN